MTVISIAEAKKTFSALIKRAAAGGASEIGAYGYPQVALVPSVVRERGVRFGSLAGQLVVPPDFDAPLPAGVLADFDGADL